MMRTLRNTRGFVVLTALALGASLGAWGQNSSGQTPSGQSLSGQSLGDVARKARQERASGEHASANYVQKEDDDGPDSGGVWRTHLCSQTPCYELAISLPKSPKWSRPAAEPRPVLIPLVGQEQDSSHAIRVYAASYLPQPYNMDRPQRMFLQGWFARPEYFGQAARLVLDEHIMIDGRAAMVTHFTVNAGSLKYRGLSVVVVANYSNFGFACAFREEDAGAAGSICDAILKSARIQTLEPAKPQYDPGYQPPPQYYPEYNPRRYDDPPPDDPPDNDYQD
jgi:hypothetical protein